MSDAEETDRRRAMVRVARRVRGCRVGLFGLALWAGAAASAQVARPAIPIDPLSAAWTSVGPAQIASQHYGKVTGRVTAVAIDPADSSGNTVYLGTTGGGVWKSINAAEPAGSVTFVPLTDTLPIFSANAGSAVSASLSIGAVSVSPAGVLLAGTGDVNDALDSYYGEGILRSADRGLNWTVVQDVHDPAGGHAFLGLGVAGFAWSTATPGLVVVAMSQSAEGVLVNAPDWTASVMGLYYSTDAGVTWLMATIEDGSQIVQQPLPGGYRGNAATAVVWNAMRQRFYAAVQFHGYYESADGMTWTRLPNQPGGLTLAVCPTNPGSVGSPGCPMFRGALAVQTTTGDTFALTVDVNNLDQGLWQDVCGRSGTGCASNEITFGKNLGTAALEVGGGSTKIQQADYNLALAAVATGSGASADTLLFAGTVDLYRCSVGSGCGWRNTTNAVNACASAAMVAPAEHAIAVLAEAGTGGMPLVYIGNDGGIWRSTDGVNQMQTPCSADDATHFQNLNGGLGSLAEVVSFAQHPTDPATMLVGLGGNGTAATSAAIAGAPWPQVSAAEGGTVAIDPANPQNWYISAGAGVNLRYCGKGTACTAADFAVASTIGFAQVGDDLSLIDAPFVLDPLLTSNVLIGTCKVWRGPAQSGLGWPGTNAISTMLGGSVNGACAGTNAKVRSLAAGGPASGVVAAQDAGSTVLYAGMAGRLDGGGNFFGGHVFVNSAAGTAGAGTVWKDVAKSPVSNPGLGNGVFNPSGFDISSVTVDAHDTTGMTVYATVMAFARNGLNTSHVYQSVNGGTSWTSISANLSNVPANGLAVDPNDANTVYVAMDTGVYVTTQVSNCPTTNCWSLYGTALPSAPVTELVAAAGMATGDGRSGELRAATYGRGVWQIPLLTATYPAVPAMTLSPASLTFATQAVATQSTAQTILVTNSGRAPLSTSQIGTKGDFTETDNCVGIVAVGASCSVQVKFLPTATGARTGMVTIYGNVVGGQATAVLNGTGAPAAAIVLNPISVTYQGTNVGSASAAQNITISNMGGVTASLQTPVVTGNFTISADTCGASLATNVGCTVSVKFTPQGTGTRVGNFSITDSAGTQTASLIGSGLSPATDALAPLGLTFGVQQLNSASATQQVMLTNSGDASLTLIAAQISSGDFTVVNGCGNSLAGHSTCSLLVAFVPKSVGPGGGVLTVADEFRTQTVGLIGVGVAPAGVSLSPVRTLEFAATGVGLSAVGQTVTLTNNGGVTLLIQSVKVTGDFGVVAGSNTCGASLATGAACVMQIVFVPTAAGTRAGSLTVVDSAGSSPQSLQLSGMGIDFVLDAGGSTTQTIKAGAQAVYPLLLTSAGGLPGTVAFECTGAPAYSTCVVSPSTAVLGGTLPVSVTVATDVAEMRLPGLPGSPWMWLAGLLPLGFLGRGRRRWRGVAMICCLLAIAGCGASRLIPLTTTGGGGSTTLTPSGTYNVVVSGTSAGLSRSIGLTLIVQ